MDGRCARAVRVKKRAVTREGGSDAGEGASESSVSSSAGARSSGTELEARKRAFWETFWTTLEENRGKAPFMKRRGTDDGRERRSSGDEDARTEVWTVPKGSDTFWGRCTIGGLMLAVAFAWSAWELTHWPTVRFVAMNPSVFVFNPLGLDAEASVSVVLEIVRRLAKPTLRFIASWCAMRSHWRAMWATFAASFLCPNVLSEVL